MLEVSESAQKEIATYFQGKDPLPIRLFLQEGGWGGPSISMAIDNEKKANDNVYEIGGFEYLVDKEFMVQTASIKIDFNGFGFLVSSGIPQGGACGGCGTSSECCG